MGEEATARCVEMAWQVTVNQCQVLVDTIKKKNTKKSKSQPNLLQTTMVVLPSLTEMSSNTAHGNPMWTSADDQNNQ